MNIERSTKKDKNTKRQNEENIQSERESKDRNREKTTTVTKKERREGERREDCGSEEATQLPDHVIAERRCQNAAEEKSMHIRQRREDEGEEEGEKRTKRRRETREVSREASRSY